MGASASHELVRSWETEDVAKMASKLGKAFAKHSIAEVIEEYGVNGKILLELTEEDVKEMIPELGRIHLKNLLIELRALKEATAAKERVAIALHSGLARETWLVDNLFSPRNICFVAPAKDPSVDLPLQASADSFQMPPSKKYGTNHPLIVF